MISLMLWNLGRISGVSTRLESKVFTKARAIESEIGKLVETESGRKLLSDYTRLDHITRVVKKGGPIKSESYTTIDIIDKKWNLKGGSKEEEVAP